MKTIALLFAALIVVATGRNSRDAAQAASAASPTPDVSPAPQGESGVITLDTRKKTFEESLPTIRVTYIGGGKDLQQRYPDLAVQDNEQSASLKMAIYFHQTATLPVDISALELPEKMSDKKHREFVESHLDLERLTNWETSKKLK